ncbi:uncharacterized protein LOC115887766 [Sitophilus oryzae]|uniref:Uncharacterized protein LOC115887766 n=1 Tax=Sitophilus oryzae TaxID=7048 RepID=A0A6J2YIZ8_SITOR|nr:uncharacterized protein LOC115887766 [Sitophilus oryzae]
MGDHITSACLKVQLVIKALSILLTNLRGPSASKRRVLTMAMQSIVMYGAPVWAEAMKIKKFQRRIIQLQRIMGIRTCSGYRTISVDAAILLGGLAPLHLLAAESKLLFEKKLARNPPDVLRRKQARRDTLIK